jgi:ferredoxin-thioredoxin reductase catalytic subunit
MNRTVEINKQELDKTYKKLKKDAESSGYHLNPELDFTKDLIKGLLINEKRYGYWACPCRLSSGKKSEDIDIICPCDYRDADLNEYGVCYCSLYVSNEVSEGRKEIEPIPERRTKKNIQLSKNNTNKDSLLSLTKPVWRCKVCGYLCGREEPPETCPICKAKKDRFEKFISKTL